MKIEEISFDGKVIIIYALFVKGKVEQPEIRALINEENLKLIPSFGVVNSNKILQIESLKKSQIENEQKKYKRKENE